MAIDVSAVIGSPEIAGTVVHHAGHFRRHLSRSVTGGEIMPKRSQGVHETPEFSTTRAYLALTDKELVLVGLKNTVRGLDPTGVLTRVPRGDVVSAEVGKGLAPPLTITLADGQSWQFEIPNPGILAVVPSQNTRKIARRSAEALSGAAATL